MDVAPPGEVHPYYADNKTVIEWVLGHLHGWPQHEIQIPRPVKVTLATLNATSPLEPSPRPIVMQRRLASAPAPYVGDPYVYVWEVGVDDLGRQVAGFAYQRFKDAPHERYS